MQRLRWRAAPMYASSTTLLQKDICVFGNGDRAHVSLSDFSAWKRAIER